MMPPLRLKLLVRISNRQQDLTSSHHKYKCGSCLSSHNALLIMHPPPGRTHVALRLGPWVPHICGSLCRACPNASALLRVQSLGCEMQNHSVETSHRKPFFFSLQISLLKNTCCILIRHKMRIHFLGTVALEPWFLMTLQ